MPAVVFSGSKVKALKDRLSLNDTTEIISVNADPSSGAGVAAPLGSIAMDYLAGKVYKKTGALATEWQELGAGLGGINYIENPDAESGTAGWATYADAAGSQPVDGTGGTANITWSRSTTSPLRGVADFNLVKDAVNRQGQGVSYDFTIDLADQAKILTISFDYEVLSGTYATGDLAVYVIQDPAGTPVVLQPAGFQVEAATVGNKVREVCTFQTASNVTSYRLCIHVASTSASAYSLAIDNVSVSPQQVVYGAPVTDVESATFSVSTDSGTMTNFNIVGKRCRIGDRAYFEGQINFTGAGGTFSGLKINLPSGVSIDTSKITGTENQKNVGEWTMYDNGTADYGPSKVVYESTTAVRLLYSAVYTHTGTAPVWINQVSGTAPFTWASGDRIFFKFEVPILGWSSSVVVSSSTDTRVVAAEYTTLSSTTITNGTALRYTTRAFDTHSSYDTSNGRFTAPVPGIYRISIGGVFTTAAIEFAIQVNGVVRLNYFGGMSANVRNNFNTMVSVNAGDYITIVPVGSTTAGDTTFGWCSFERLSGPSQIAASETVAASYATSSGNSLTAATATLIVFGTRDFDTHNFYSTSSGLATIPMAGKYRLSVLLTNNGTTLTTNQTFEVQVFKNGVFARHLSATTGNGGSTTYRVGGTTTLNLMAGDTIAFYGQTPNASTLFPNAAYNHFSIERIGN